MVELSKDAMEILARLPMLQPASGYTKPRSNQKIPIDIVIRRLKVGDYVAERLRRLNPDGLQPGSRPRGLFRKRTGHPINQDVMLPAEFIRLYGREAYRNVPRSAVIKDGKRKMFTREYCMELGLGHV